MNRRAFFLSPLALLPVGAAKGSVVHTVETVGEVSREVTIVLNGSCMVGDEFFECVVMPELRRATEQRDAVIFNQGDLHESDKVR